MPTPQRPKHRILSRLLWPLLLLLSLPLLSPPTDARELRPGEVVTLVKGSSETVDIVIPQTGEYRIQTTGESDTRCELYDRWRGKFATDDNSGEAKNCRFDRHLVKGTYRIKVTKHKRAVYLSLRRYQEIQASEALTEGTTHDTTLTAGNVRAFEIQIRRRRWLHVEAFGATLHHCRLFSSKRWSIDTQQSLHTISPKYSKHTQLHKLHHCTLSRLVEPGQYRFEVYGDLSTPNTQSLRRHLRNIRIGKRTKAQKQAKLQVHYGSRYLPPAHWQQVNPLPQHYRQTRWFQVPRKYADEHGRVLLYIQTSNIPSGFRMTLQREGWTQRPRRVTSCYGSWKWGMNYTCVIRTHIQPDTRYTLRFRSPRNQPFKVRTIPIIDKKQQNPFNRRVTLSSTPGTLGELHFRVHRSGKYWLEAGPHVRTCLLERIQRTNTIIGARTLVLNTQKPRELKLNVEGEGFYEWVHLPAQGTLTFGTRGKADTKCFLYDLHGTLMDSNDDARHQGRNCQVQRILNKGYYRIQVRHYRRRSTKTTLRLHFTPQVGQTLPIATEGCQGVVPLQAGQYRLLTGQGGSFTINQIGLLPLPLRTHHVVRLSLQNKASQLPIALTTKHTHIQIKHTTSCALSKGGKTLAKGAHKGDICTIRGAFSPGTYTLHLGASPPHSKRTTIVKLDPRATFSIQKVFWPKPPTPPLSFKPIPKLRSKRRTFFDLARQQERRYTWKVRRSGIYHIESLGLLKIACTLQTQATPRLFSNQRSGPGDNCQLIQYLPKGLYQLRVRALDRSRGRAGILARRLRMAWGGRLKPRQRHYRRLKPGLGQVYNLSIQKDDFYTVGVHSLDANVLCRIEQKGNWPLFGGQRCNKRLHLEKGSYNLWLYPTPKTSRYRILVHDDDFRTIFWPPATKRLPQQERNAKVKLRLHGSYRTRLSTLGQDVYQLEIPTQMTLRFSLSSTMFARLFRNNTFVANINTRNSAPTISLKPGKYRLTAQHKKGRSSVWYSLGASVLKSAPGSRLWRTLPSTISLQVTRRSRIEIDTEGNPDTWCQLHQHGMLVAQNDDSSRKRWDCRISRLLQPGTYTLRLEGRGATWLQLHERRRKRDTALTLNQKTHLRIHKEHIHGGTFTLKDVQAVRLFSRAKRRPLGCALEDIKHATTLGESGGRRCSLFRLLTPGSYRWRIRSLRNKPARAQVKLTTLQTQRAPLNHALSLTLAPKTPKFLIFQITRAGLYRLDTNGKDTRCGLAPQGGPLAWTPCNKARTLDRGWYLWWLENRSRQPQTTQATLKEEHIDADTPFSVQLHEDRIQFYRLSLKTSGLYAIDVTGQGAKAWGCQLQKAPAQWPTHGAAGGLRCRLYARLDAGEHTLKLWRPKEAHLPHAQGRVLIRQLHKGPLPNTNTPWPGTSQSITLDKQAKQWQLHGWRGLGGHLTLQGHGVALLLANGQVRQACEAQGSIKTCAWSTIFPPKQVTLWLHTTNTLNAQLNLKEQRAESRFRISRHVTEWSASGQVRTRRLSFKTKTPILLEASSQGAQCLLRTEAPAFQMGCKHALKAHKAYTFVVRSKGHAGNIAIYPKGQRAQALWGSMIPKPKVPLPPAGRLQAEHKIAFYHLTLKATRIVKLRFHGSPAVCAVGKQNMPAFATTQAHDGCQLELPLHAGTYWFGVRGFARGTLRGTLQTDFSIPQTTREGRQSGGLLTQHNSRWFQISIPQHRKIGLGVVGKHEDLHCVLTDATHKVIARGCMNYRKLTPGQYWLKATLLPRAQATPTSFVLRGTRPPPNKPPLPYLKNLIGQSR